MLPEIAKAYLEGRVMLLLGAGASATSSDASGVTLPMGAELAKELAGVAKLDYSDEPLSIAYSAAAQTDSAGLEKFFVRRLTQTKPGPDLLELVRYRWSRIYTLNVDDAAEAAVRASSAQKLRVYGRHDSLVEADAVFDSVQLIKLNGSADRLGEGLIFAPQEYGSGSANVPAWYRELGQDYIGQTFVFIGSKLNEPLLQHVIAESRSGTERRPQRGYLISPKVSPLEQRHLEAANVVHVPGTLADFVAFLKAEVGPPPSGWDLATARRPELKKLATSLPPDQQRALNAVLVVQANTLPKAASSSGAIRNFYRGYKPTWSDILDGVPALLKSHAEFLKHIRTADARGAMIPLLGPAGSGKSTLMMSSALALAGVTTDPVYWLREPVGDIDELMLTLEEIASTPYYVFIDRIDVMARQLAELYEKKRVRRGTIVFAERQNIWKRRLKEALGEYCAEPHYIDRIDKDDTDAILDKLEKFGPWTRLAKMNKKEQRKEIFDKSARQLLIGLLEATSGDGFTKIIRRDYGDVGGIDHQRLIVTVGLATIHQSTLPTNLIGRALTLAGTKSDVLTLASETEGVIAVDGAHLVARHPVYIRELFEQIVDPDLIMDCIIAILDAFADYKAPVIQHTTKSEGYVFKSIINHRFLRRMMRDSEARVINIYSQFETTFHVDGLYWLQYGLALRGFGRHGEAFNMFKTAREAYISPQIEHAYAQQLLIIAEEATSWADAEPLLVDAVKSLRNQKDDSLESDSYPIVSLAEGHVRVLRKFRPEAEAREAARTYANDLNRLRKKISNERLEETAGLMTTYASTGAWTELRRTDTEWDIH